MKTIIRILLVIQLVVIVSCMKEKPLYDQVMDIHDEVMPKMDDLYKMKRSLQIKLADSVNITEDERSKIEQTVQLLDSANTSMMVWMREFNPPNEKDKEAYEKYLEGELVRVRRMRDVVMSALEKVEAGK